MNRTWQWSLGMTGMMALALTGCSTPAQPAAPGAPAAAASPAAATGPVTPKVNRVVMAIEPPARESNEVRNLSQPDIWPMKPMYEYLIGIDPKNGKLVPELATEWALDAKTLAVSFKLRTGVPFQKGNGEFTSKDVQYSWQDLVQQDSLHTQSPYFRTIIKSIEMPSPTQAVLNLSAPDGGFLRAISDGESNLEMSSKDHVAKKGASTLQTEPTVGTGAYQYQGRSQGGYVRYERTPGKHWQVTPDFPEFEFRFVKEASTRLAALITGEIQMTSLPQDLLTQAEGKGFKTVKGNVPGLRTFLSVKCCYIADPKDHSKGMRYPESPLSDVRVRKALQKAINLDELNKGFFGGKGEVMINTHFHPTRDGRNPDWEKRFKDEYGYDPAAAKALLAQAGQPALETTFILGAGQSPGVQAADDIAEAIAGYWRTIGVKVNMMTLDSVAYDANARQQKYSNHVQMGATSSAQLFGSAVWNAAIGKSGAFPSVEDPEVDDTLNALYATLEPAAQEPLFRKLGDLMYEKHMNLQLFWLPAQIIVDPKVVNDYVFPGSISGLWTHIRNVKAAR